jgi:hypothetical protein
VDPDGRIVGVIGFIAIRCVAGALLGGQTAARAFQISTSVADSARSLKKPRTQCENSKQNQEFQQAFPRVALAGAAAGCVMGILGPGLGTSTFQTLSSISGATGVAGGVAGIAFGLR